MSNKKYVTICSYGTCTKCYKCKTADSDREINILIDKITKLNEENLRMQKYISQLGDS